MIGLLNNLMRPGWDGTVGEPAVEGLRPRGRRELTSSVPCACRTKADVDLALDRLHARTYPNNFRHLLDVVVVVVCVGFRPAQTSIPPVRTLTHQIYRRAATK